MLATEACHVRMTGRRDEVQQSMDSVIPETGITFDARLFGKNVVVLTLEVADNFLEPRKNENQGRDCACISWKTYANSLSILSPNPGVSTIVKAMRTPSSSSSVNVGLGVKVK